MCIFLILLARFFRVCKKLGGIVSRSLPAVATRALVSTVKKYMTINSLCAHKKHTHTLLDGASPLFSLLFMRPGHPACFALHTYARMQTHVQHTCTSADEQQLQNSMPPVKLLLFSFFDAPPCAYPHTQPKYLWTYIHA